MVQTTLYKINKLQKYFVQHREYNQCFIISISGIYKNFTSLCFITEINKIVY